MACAPRPAHAEAELTFPDVYEKTYELLYNRPLSPLTARGAVSYNAPCSGERDFYAKTDSKIYSFYYAILVSVAHSFVSPAQAGFLIPLAP